MCIQVIHFMNYTCYTIYTSCTCVLFQGVKNILKNIYIYIYVSFLPYFLIKNATKLQCLSVINNLCNILAFEGERVCENIADGVYFDLL